MRPVARLVVAAASALAVIVPVAGAAVADPHGPRLPSEERVAQAKKDVAAKKQSVAKKKSAARKKK